MLKRSGLPTLLLITICFLSGLWASLHYKQLFNDGAYWALNILNSGEWHLEVDYFRYVTLLIQAPAVLATNISKSVWLTPTLFCMSYFLYPFIVLAGLYQFTKNHPRKDFLHLFILTLFIAIIPNWAFGVSIVNESIVASWILISYIVFSDKPKPLWIFIFSLLIFFNYESGIMLMGLAGYISYREKKLTRFQVATFATLIVLQFLNVYFRILPRGSHKHFKTSLEPAIEGPFFKYAVASILLLVLITIAKKFPKWMVLVIASNFAVALTYKVWDLGLHQLWGQSYFDRTWAIPAAGLILFIGYELFRRNDYVLDGMFKIAFAFLMIPALFLELRLNESQVRVNKYLKRVVNYSKGCIVIPQEKQNLYTLDVYIATWSFPHLSILLNNSRKVDTILFFENYDHDRTRVPNDFCTLDHNEFITMRDQHSYYLIPTKENLDFSAIYGK